MKKLLYYAAVVCIPGGIPVAIGVFVYRRWKAKNAVVQVTREHGVLRVQPKADA